MRARTRSRSISDWGRWDRARDATCRPRRRRSGTSSCITRTTTPTGRRATSAATCGVCRRCSRWVATTMPRTWPARGVPFAASNDCDPGADNHIAIGPWSHGGWARGDGNAHGSLHWSTKTGPWFRDSIEAPFFMHYLDDGPAPALPKVLVYRTGGEQWDRYDAWPPRNANSRSLYLLPGGKLGWQRAAGGHRQGARSTSTSSDPANPVPVVGRSDRSGMPRDYMTGDQRFAAKRPDVLTFQTDPLTEDVTIAGPVTPVLHVATSGTDADFDVKLIDVFPENAPNWPGDTSGFVVAGYQQLVRGEPFRGQISARPGASGGVRAQSARLAALRHAGHRSHVQEGPPDHDSDPELVVPAHRPQSADVRSEHLRGEARRFQSGDDARVSHVDDGVADRRARAAARAGRSMSRIADSCGRRPFR